MDDLAPVIGYGLVVVLIIGLMVSLWRLKRDTEAQAQLFRHEIGELRRDVANRALRREALEHLSSTERIAERLKRLEERFAAPEPQPAPAATAPVAEPVSQAVPEPPTRQITVSQLVAAAATALGSAAEFDSFAAGHAGFGCSRWKPDGHDRPAPADGQPSQAELWVWQGQNDQTARVFPSFGLVRRLTYLTSDSGRAAEAELGAFFKITKGPQFRATEPALVDARDWRLLEKGTLELRL